MGGADDLGERGRDLSQRGGGSPRFKLLSVCSERADIMSMQGGRQERAVPSRERELTQAPGRTRAVPVKSLAVI